MKRNKIIPVLLLLLAILVSGCGKKDRLPPVYSNLNDPGIRHDLDALLQAAGVSDRQRNQFFDSVEDFNAVMEPQWLTQGFQPVGESLWDPYAVQDAWTAAYPDFMGYNCRITSYSLFAPSFLRQQEEETTPNTELLEFDLSALQEDPSAFPGQERQFLRFFGAVPTEDTQDVEIHQEKLREYWKNWGISFVPSERISMINVVMHMQEGERNTLYVGHSGILLPTPDGDLWFLEKLAFQQPYQVVQFADRQQLQDYLMEKYDLDENQPTARPFIMENDQMLKP